MKKYFVFAAMALATFMNYSCSDVDNPGNPTTGVYYLDGKDYLANVVGTFQGEVGAEVSLTLGVYDPFDVFAVDFGDGKLIVDTVCYQNGGLKDENGMTVEWRKSATVFKGTVAGKGIVTVYGNSDLWYMVLTGGIAPTSFNQERMQKLVQMSISGANMEKVELPQLNELTHFTFTNSPVKSVDISKATALTNLSIFNVADSKFEPQLTTIDVSKNTKLENISMGYASYKKGALTSIDLSKNTALSSISLANNQLKSVVLPQSTSATNLNVYLSDNELSELVVPLKVRALEAQNNELTKVTIADATYSCKLENNALTIATLPVKPASLNSTAKIKRFTYNPQADMEVTPAGAVVDLSAQAKAKGELTEEVATTYTVKAGDAVLVADTDYKIEDGKITFLKSQKDVVVEMTTTAFPKLTALKTKAFDVTVAE